MTNRSMLIYYTIILSLTAVRGQAICKNAGFVPVGTKCYRYNPDAMSEPQARANCESWNGKLAKFTSLDSLREVGLSLNILATFFWIDAPEDVQENGIKWVGTVQTNQDIIMRFSQSCSFTYRSLCVEVYDQNVTTTTAIKTGDFPNSGDNTVTTTTPKACSNSIYSPVDGVCYFLAPEWVLWQDANTHCNRWNGTFASFSSAQQGFNVLTKLMIYYKIFVNISNNNIPNFATLMGSPNNPSACSVYEYTQYHRTDATARILCIEMPPITTTEATTTKVSTTAPELPTTSEPITERDPITTPEPTTVSETTTTSKPITISKSNTTPESADTHKTTTKPISITTLKSITIPEPTTLTKSTTRKERTTTPKQTTTTKQTTTP